jgi:hypothetical protein
MPSKKTTRKPAKRTTKKKQAEPILTPEQKRGITAVIFSMLALLLAFAVFNFGGTLTTAMLHYLRLAFGYAAYLLPVICGLLAYMLFRTDIYEVRTHNYVGFTGFVVSLAALFHVGIARADAATNASDGLGGGYLGYLSSNVLLNILNVAASTVVLLAALLIFMIVATGADFGSMLGWVPGMFRREPRDDKLKPAEAIAEGITVNDNSGAALPIRGTIGGDMPPRPAPAKEEPQEALTAGADADWKAPELALLSQAVSKADAGDVKANAAIIQQTMESFNIGVTMGEVNVGPARN